MKKRKKGCYIVNDFSILLCGKSGSGKSTLSNLILSMFVNEFNYPHTQIKIKSLAQPIKDFALNMGWNGEKNKRGRELLQSIGDVVNKYDPNRFCTILHDDYDYNCNDSERLVCNKIVIIDNYFKSKFSLPD